MKNFGILLLVMLSGTLSHAQQRSKFSLQINYGFNWNFSVRSYNEWYGPAQHEYFLKKNLIGSISSINAAFYISKKSSLFAEYSKTVNLGRKNYSGDMNGVDIYIHDFRIRNVNNVFQLGISRDLWVKRSTLKLDGGLVVINEADQGIEIENSANGINIAETNFNNANSQEGGVFLGLGWSTKIDTKFDIGLKSRIFYLISIDMFELISLTPTLTYHFIKRKPKQTPKPNLGL